MWKIIIFILFLFSCSTETPKAPQESRDFHLLVIGDSQSLGNTTLHNGQWFEFNNSLKAYTGRETILLNAAVGGSGYASAVYENNWGEKGKLYFNMVVAAENHLQQFDKEKFDLIFLALGGQDAIGSESFDKIQVNMEWVIERLKEDFSDTPIFISKAPGKDSYSEKMKRIRALQEKIINEETNIFKAFDLASFDERNAYINSFHLIQDYYDIAGKENAELVKEIILGL